MFNNVCKTIIGPCVSLLACVGTMTNVNKENEEEFKEASVR